VAISLKKTTLILDNIIIILHKKNIKTCIKLCIYLLRYLILIK